MMAEPHERLRNPIAPLEIMGCDQDEEGQILSAVSSLDDFDTDDDYNDEGLSLVSGLRRKLVHVDDDGGDYERSSFRPLYCGASVLIVILVLAIVSVPPNRETSSTTITTGNLSKACRRLEDPHEAAKDSFWSDWIDEEVNAPVRCSVASQSADRPCNCLNPVVPHPSSNPGWTKTVNRNRQAALTAVSEGNNPDVVIMGDSIVEHLQGTDLGVQKSELRPIKQTFDRIFKKTGLALGVGGDRCINLLDRLDDEVASNLDPTVWWIVVGTNDFGGDHCRPASVVAGITAVVEGLQRLRPEAIVVVNSILPRGSTLEDPIPPLVGSIGWEAVQEANAGIACYAASHKKVEFFNSTDFFVVESTGAMNASLYVDPVHPSALGTHVWGQAIYDRIQELVLSTSG